MWIKGRFQGLFEVRGEGLKWVVDIGGLGGRGCCFIIVYREIEFGKFGFKNTVLVK